MRRVLWLTALVVAASIATTVTVRAVYFNASVSASGAVQAVTLSQLNFANAGSVIEIRVHPGDHVRTGQVLARQTDSVFQTSIAAHQAALAADQARLILLQQPLRPPQIQQLQLLIDQANQLLTTARTHRTDAAAVNSNLTQKAASDVQRAQADLAADQQAFAAFAATCAGIGPPVLPTASAAPASTPTPLPTLSAGDTILEADLCQREQQQLKSDAGAISLAQEAYQLAVTTQQTGDNEALQAVLQAQSQVTLAVNGQAVGLLRGTPADIAAAQAAISKDTSDITTDQQSMHDATLTAPIDGVVSYVSGVIGEVASSDGVHAYPAPQGLPQAQPGFTLFPPPQQPNTQQNNGFAPMVEVYSGGMAVVAQVGENDIRKLGSDTVGTATFPALPNMTVTVRMDRIEPQAVSQSNGTFYLVIFRIVGDVHNARLLPGMSANVSF
jgi:multidrug efflux pump subunit AcrA (membrane-fusion protein)